MTKLAKKSEDEIDISLIKDVHARTGEIADYVNKVKEAGAIKKLPVRYHHSISFLAWKFKLFSLELYQLESLGIFGQEWRRDLSSEKQTSMG